MLRTSIVLFLVTFSLNVMAQTKAEIPNVIIITLDGMRWQEIFKGVDSSLVNDSKFNQNRIDYLFKKYGAPDPVERRKKLMPFLWSTIEQQGQIMGNRAFGNYVNVANPYWVSFPGYSEIFCGMVDSSITSNKLLNNPNLNFLEVINQTPQFKNKVAIFGAWNAFPYIFNTERNHLPISSAFKPITQNRTEREKLIQEMLQQSFKPFDEGECLDVFTHFQAMEYLKLRKPKVMFVGYGETDEWAHAGKYKYYLDAANQSDTWISEIWKYIQTEPFYKDKTLLIVTTDHGRGVGELWTDHNNKVAGSDQTWFAIIGPLIKPLGEIKKKDQIYHKQYARTITDFLGVKFSTASKSIVFQ